MPCELCIFDFNCITIPKYLKLPSPPKPDNILISVCASTWNRSQETIIKSIESIYKQKFPTNNYEVILVDDSTKGEREHEARKAAEYLISTYPDHLFRAYFTNFTRCWTDPHTLNVAYKRAKGDIVMTSQVDLVHLGETLEQAWRHHSTRSNLWLCPRALQQNHKLWPHVFYPHEMAASVRKQWIEKIQGRNERIKVVPPDLDYHNWLNNIGVVFAQDWTASVIHDYTNVGAHPQAPEVDHPELFGQGLRDKDGTWVHLSEYPTWGFLHPDEEEKTIYSNEYAGKL